MATVRDALIASHTEQANYYREKTADIVSGRGKRVWTRMEWIAMLGPVVAIAGVLSAFFATYSSVVELRASREVSISESQASRDDADFYKAMERMGDKDSATARASAGQLLARKALIEKYYEPAKLQLVYALLLEDDPVVLGAIQGAIRILMHRRPDDFKSLLCTTSKKIEQQVVAPMAVLTLDGDDKVPDSVTADQWTYISALVPLTEFTEADLSGLIAKREEAFLSYQTNAERIRIEMTKEQIHAANVEAIRDFRAAALRLRLIRNLLELAETKQP